MNSIESHELLTSFSKSNSETPSGSVLVYWNEVGHGMLLLTFGSLKKSQMHCDYEAMPHLTSHRIRIGHMSWRVHM